MNKFMAMLLVAFTLVAASGCTSARPYFAPTAEEQDQWKQEDAARNKDAKTGLLGGPFGDFLGLLASIGQVFK